MNYRPLILPALCALLWGATCSAQTAGGRAATTLPGEPRPLERGVRLSDSASVGINSIAPNPCAASTTISFALPVEGEALLVLNDPFGREVVKLAEGAMAPGEHSIRLKTGELAEGSYLCVLRSGGVVAVWPLVVMR